MALGAGFLRLLRWPEIWPGIRASRKETMQPHVSNHQKLKRIFDEVLLNEKQQERWSETVDPDFISCMEVMIKRYDQALPREQWMRTGVMLGAVYEQWRRKQREIEELQGGEP